MGYVEMFDSIVEIMHNDYSGCIHKLGWDKPAEYRQAIEEMEKVGIITDLLFKNFVEEYLWDFKDYNVSIDYTLEEEKMTNGFIVRRHEDVLHIVKSTGDSRVMPGMIITHIDGLEIAAVAENQKKFLHAQPPERQEWSHILMRAKTCMIQVPGGLTWEQELKKYKKLDISKRKYEFKQYDKDTFILKVPHFGNKEEMDKLLSAHKEELERAKALIIDVRENEGGIEAVGLSLLEYCFDEGEVYEPTEAGYYNWTANNAETGLRYREYLLEKNDDPEQRGVYEFLKNLEVPGVYDITRCEGCKPYSVKGKKGPMKVAILIDVYCQKACEEFLMYAKASKKVTLVGRATKGALDYSNIYGEEVGEHFILSYPVCYYGRVNEGQGIDYIGIEPDVLVPWTPEHIEEDVDLNIAIKYLKRRV